jgi:hypothetical protein
MGHGVLPEGQAPRSGLLLSGSGTHMVTGSWEEHWREAAVAALVKTCRSYRHTAGQMAHSKKAEQRLLVNHSHALSPSSISIYMPVDWSSSSD